MRVVNIVVGTGEHVNVLGEVAVIESSKYMS